MRIKEYFTVPKGQKVTEKNLRRVLICSICSILLCMSCLAGTTWAWYVVGIENTANEIYIAAPQVVVTVDGSKLDVSVTSATLSPGEHTIQIEHANELDDLNRKSELYVTLTADGTSQYIILDHDNMYTQTITVKVDENGTVDTETVDATSGGANPVTKKITWQATWFKADGAEPVVDGTIDLTTKPDMSPPPSTEETESTDTSESTTETTQPITEATTPSTAPTETTSPSTTPSETTQPTTEATQSPAETTQPTETTAPSTPPVSEDTNSTETTEATQESNPSNE